MVLNIRSRAREVAVLGFAVIILLPILFTAAPWTVKAQESPVVTGSPAKLSPKQHLLYVIAHSPFFASLIQDTGLLETASDLAPAWSAEGVAPEASTTQIEYWRDVTVACFVRASSFAGLKVDWKSFLLGTSYLGDCLFEIEYGAEYTGATPMSNLVITDTWKKGLEAADLDLPETDLSLPYIIASHSTEFDTYGTCSDAGGVDFYYEPSTGAVTITIGPTTGAFKCGTRLGIISRSGLDSSVFSPKPSVSGTVIDVSTGKKVKPEDMDRSGTHWYTLQVEMKPFAIKSPALAKQSSFEYAQFGLFASRYHAVTGTGMYLENFDPYWYSSIYGIPPSIDTDASASWTYWNNVYAGSAPSTPKVIFPPSLITTTKFQKSDAIVGPNIYDPGTNTGKLYAAQLRLIYLHKGISFITGNDIYFSGNPPDIAPIRYEFDVSWDLFLGAGYPDYTCAGPCA